MKLWDMIGAKENKKEKKASGAESKFRRVLALLANGMDTVHTNSEDGHVTITIRATISRKDYETMMDA